MVLDTSTEFGTRADKRLHDDKIAWLVTVAPDGTPQPNPVWFLWEGESAVVYSLPKSHKVRNIARHPEVALHLQSDDEGGDVIVLVGEARFNTTGLPANKVPAFQEKYRDGITGIGMSPAKHAKDYSAAIRVTPTKIRGF